MVTKPGSAFVEWPSTVEDKTDFDSSLKNTGYASEDVPEHDNFNYLLNTNGLWLAWLEDTIDAMYADRTWTIADVADWNDMCNEILALASANDNTLNGDWIINITTDTLTLNSVAPADKPLVISGFSGSGSITINGNTAGAGQTTISSSIGKAYMTFENISVAGGIAINDIIISESTIGSLSTYLIEFSDVINGILLSNVDLIATDSDTVCLFANNVKYIYYKGGELTSANTSILRGAIVATSGSSVYLGSVTAGSGGIDGNGAYVATGSTIHAADTTTLTPGGGFSEFEISGGIVNHETAGTWALNVNSF